MRAKVNTSVVPYHNAAQVAPRGFRLTLERLPGERVQTGLIDVDGVEFSAWRRGDRVDAAVESLARELARHLGVARGDVSINETAGDDVRGKRRFRLIAWYRGRPKEVTDGSVAFRQWKNSGSVEPKQIPEYIDI